MCINDYEFRHWDAIRPKQCRRFRFSNQDQIQKGFLVNISQFQQHGEVALCKIFIYLSQKGLPIVQRQFYWPKYNVSLQAGDYCKVPFEALAEKQIFFKTFRITNQLNTLNGDTHHKQQMDIQEPWVSNIDQNDNLSEGACLRCIEDISYENQLSVPQTQVQDILNSQNIQNEQKLEKIQMKQENQIEVEKQTSNFNKSEQNNHKRIKEPERIISEVIGAVKLWRKLYQRKTLNLTKAAKVIGISKKSLDDYYLILRVGQILGFDFQKNLDKKMGDLRAFIRTFDNKITGKLTKQVKCFDLIPDVQIDQETQNLIQKLKGSQQDHMD